MCARAEEKLSRRRERGVRRERERERGVCACAGRARPGSTGDSQKLGLGRFFKGKKVAEGVCNVAKLATLCISISPTMGRATGQTENTRCVNRALKKLVPLK